VRLSTIAYTLYITVFLSGGRTVESAASRYKVVSLVVSPSVIPVDGALLPTFADFGLRLHGDALVRAAACVDSQNKRGRCFITGGHGRRRRHEL
jgi:hypothetical protein